MSSGNSGSANKVYSAASLLLVGLYRTLEQPYGILGIWPVLEDPMSLVFREAAAEDVPYLMAIRTSVTENVLSDPGSITPELCAEYLTVIGKGWVCEIDCQLVGFSIAALKETSIWALFIHPDFEGRGIGTMLLDLAVGWIFETGASKIFLSTGIDTKADQFYTSRGWSRGELLPNGEVRFTLERPPAT